MLIDSYSLTLFTKAVQAGEVAYDRKDTRLLFLPGLNSLRAI